MIASASGTFNISSYAQVQAYTAPNDIYLISRMMLGSAGKPVAGNGAYYAKYSINGQERDDVNTIAAGLTRIFIHSHPIKLDKGDILLISAKGLAGDTSVDITAGLGDVTPSMTGLWGGGGSRSVWSEEEKNRALKELSQILTGVRSILSKDELKVVSESLVAMKTSLSGLSGQMSSNYLALHKELKDEVINLVAAKFLENHVFIESLDLGLKTMTPTLIQELKTVLEKNIPAPAPEDQKEVNKTIIDKLKVLNDSVDILEKIIIKSTSTEILEEIAKDESH